MKGDWIYFAATDVEHGLELWRTDGSAVGTRLAADVRPDAVDSRPESLTSVGGAVYFFADGGGSEFGLWRSEGTRSTTLLVTRETPYDPRSRNPAAPPVARLPGMLLYRGNAGGVGLELNRAVGLEVSVVEDIRPGPESSFPGNFSTLEDLLLFSASDPAFGHELYRTDGTRAGTWLVADINPGPDSSWPGPVVATSDSVYFEAFFPGVGMELWAIERDAVRGAPNP